MLLLWASSLSSDHVAPLLVHDPFPDDPPRWVQVVAHRYRFTRWGDGSPQWWERERVEVLIGPLSAEHPALLAHVRARGWEPAAP